MALSYYDPLSDLCLGLPCPRDHWGVCHRDPLASLGPLTSWEGSLVPKDRNVSLWRNPVTEVVSDKDKFQVTLPLNDFKSNEVNVKLVDRSLVISAEHEEKPDEHGHIYRRITRSYLLPRNVDCDKLTATFSDKGTLVVCAQKKAIEEGNERKIEVKKVTSQPQQQVSQKTQQEAGKAKGTSIPVTHETGKKA